MAAVASAVAFVPALTVWRRRAPGGRHAAGSRGAPAMAPGMWPSLAAQYCLRWNLSADGRLSVRRLLLRAGEIEEVRAISE
jgi:hypothetical protein